MSESTAVAELGSLTRAAEIQGLIDNVQPGRIFGWAWNRSAPGERLQIEMRLGDTVVASTVADSERSDLASGQIGDGRHAFDLPLTPEALERRAEITIIARADNGEELVLPIRAVRRNPAGLAAVPAGGNPPASAATARSLPQAVQALSVSHGRLRHQLEELADRMPAGERAAAASAVADLQSRIETLELRCLAADEQLAALAAKRSSSEPSTARLLDPWQIILGLLMGVAAGGALFWSLTGVTPLLFGG